MFYYVHTLIVSEIDYAILQYSQRPQTDLFFEIMCRLIRVFFPQLVVSNVVKMQNSPSTAPLSFSFVLRILNDLGLRAVSLLEKHMNQSE